MLSTENELPLKEWSKIPQEYASNGNVDLNGQESQAD